MSETEPTNIQLPTAELRPVTSGRRISFAWIVPAIVLLISCWIGWQAWNERGIAIVIRLTEAHGLKVGDHIRYRGTSVGDVRAMRLADDLDGLIVTARLNRDAAMLARSGSRFWVVRPAVTLDGATGLDTLVGPRYIAVLPANPSTTTELQREFIALDHPPLIESFHPDDLEVLVHSRQRGSLAPGVPVLHRQVRIGTVLSVGLTSDAGGVEARLHIQRAFVPLIRENSRFWDSGGYSAKLDWRGVNVELDSWQTLVTGAVAVATPPLEQAGAVVRTGHRFTLAPDPQRAWLDWEPLISIGNELLPHGRSLPKPLRARLAWTESRLIGSSRQVRRGWVLHTERGLLGPADLISSAAKAREGSSVLEVAGIAVPLGALEWTQRGVALLPANLDEPHWPASLMRTATEIEDCIIVGDAADARPIAAARMTAADGLWHIHPTVQFDETWHGAAVVSRRDGSVIGILLVNDASSHIALLPE